MIQSRKLALLSASTVLAFSLFTGVVEAQTKGTPVQVQKTESESLDKLELTASMKDTLKKLQEQWPEMKDWQLKSSRKTDTIGFLDYDTGTKGRKVSVVLDLKSGLLKKANLMMWKDSSWSSEKAPSEAKAKEEATAFLKAVFGKEAEAYEMDPKVKTFKQVFLIDKDGKPKKYAMLTSVFYHRVVNGKAEANNTITITVDQHGEVIDFAHTILPTSDKSSK
jgi:hypothetical protein